MPVPEELRFALVMNGGVSLAVWMGGVAHELDLLRRAASGAGSGTLRPQWYDDEIFQKWASACAGRRVVIDIIAGTSAGGINGTLLAAAIARGATLDPANADRATAGPWLREQWAALGALKSGSLIPRPVSKRTGSALDGEFFTEHARKLISQIRGDGPQTPVTLFLTATSAGPGLIRFTDARQAFTVADHRRLYRFRHDTNHWSYAAPKEPRTDRVRLDAFSRSLTNDLESSEPLALAARGSASFPLAFAPVQETDKLNREPPRIMPAGESRPAWLMDGGILNNSPFGPVLDEVAARPIAGPAKRYVLYVVPSAGEPAPEAGEDAKQPSWQQVVIKAVSYPREADYRSGIAELGQLLARSADVWSHAVTMFAGALADPGVRSCHAATARSLLPVYRQAVGRAELRQARSYLSQDVVTRLDDPDIDPSVYETLTHLGLPVQRLASQELTLVPWSWGVEAAHRCVLLMLRYLRRLLDDDPESPRIPDALTGLSRLTAQVRAVHRELRLKFPSDDVSADPPAADVARRLSEVYAELSVPAALTTLVTAATELVAGVISDPTGIEQILASALAVEVTVQCFSTPGDDTLGPPFTFLRLGPDVSLPILDGTPEAGIAAAIGDRILYGTQLAHFGAFGDASWRRWDWLLGRLHTVAHLGQVLGMRRESIAEAQSAVLQAEGMAQDTFRGRIRDMRSVSLAAMRSALAGPSGDEQALQDIGERSVEVAAMAAPTGLRPYVQVILGRDAQPKGQVQGLVRWLTAPARAAVWQVFAVSAPGGAGGAPPALIQTWRWRFACIVFTLITLALTIAGAVAAAWWPGLLAGLALFGALVTGVCWKVSNWAVQRQASIWKRLISRLGTLPSPSKQGEQGEQGEQDQSL
jgi:predicted acylesterase/phospholipase RssA